MKYLFYTFILVLLFNTHLNSQSTKCFFNEGIVFIKNYKLNIKDTIIDGRTYKYPVKWNLKKGTDNNIITYPNEWILNEGKDGHLVAFPSNWTVNQGNDGRLVPYLYEEKLLNYKEKKKD